ncbi:MAG: ABC transporter permease, partial [Myxococcota bacterium]
MRTIVKLASSSLWSRRVTVFLTVLSVATSFSLLISVERLRSTTRASFESTISGTDLLVGARGSGLQLLLYSVFRIGEPVQEVGWETYEALNEHPEIAWTVPLALGDSVKGFRVLGTTPEYFDHYRYGEKQPLAFETGEPFARTFEAVLGSEVADELGWRPGKRFPIQHGVTEEAHAHDHLDFEVVGVLSPTGTPVDRTVHVTLAGLGAAHTEPDEDHEHEEEHAHDEDHEHEEEHAHDEDHEHEEEHAHDEDHEHEEAHAESDVQ